MASNPKWCLSVTEWKAQFKNWITHPDPDKIMLCNIFFDYDLVYGNLDLVAEMSTSIFEAIDSYEIFLNFMGQNALKNPAPLSFFRNFLVEDSGEHKDQFDIKARAIMPLVDAARLLVLSHNTKDVNSTIARFKKLAEIEPQTKDLYESCISAFRILLRFRTQQGLKNNDSGRFIDLNSLSKADRLKLKGCFKPIKEIQDLLKVRFKLSQLL
ncbi:MAG: nucleotidyltransferase, partial [Oceanihabitans sp.]|nr:nucleotidyltransferase [Oceanihabitans sp.]